MFVSQSVDGVNELVVLDAATCPTMLSPLAVHTSMRNRKCSRYRHRFQSSKPRVVAAQVVVALAA